MLSPAHTIRSGRSGSVQCDDAQLVKWASSMAQSALCIHRRRSRRAANIQSRTRAVVTQRLLSWPLRTAGAASDGVASLSLRVNLTFRNARC